MARHMGREAMRNSSKAAKNKYDARMGKRRLKRRRKGYIVGRDFLYPGSKE